MKSIKTILVPTDFSSAADYAIHYAAGLSKYLNSSIILYHSFIPFESGFYPPTQSKKENHDTEKSFLLRLSKIRDKILKTNPDVSVSIHVDRGPESLRLVEFCTAAKIDLVVMGTTGASGLKEVIMGSFTSNTMAKAPCPVLAIPKGYRFKSIKQITFASDFHRNELQAIKFINLLSAPFESRLHLLHIYSNESVLMSQKDLFSKYKASIMKLRKGTPVSFQLTTGENISSVILSITSKDKTDILAMSPIRHDGFWHSLFHKSVTKATANHIRKPLLSIPIV